MQRAGELKEAIEPASAHDLMSEKEPLPAKLLAAVGPLVESQALKHGGRQVQAVVRHRRADAVEGEAQWLVEKRLKAFPFAPPARELLFYKRVAPAVRIKPLDLPRVC